MNHSEELVASSIRNKKLPNNNFSIFKPFIFDDIFYIEEEQIKETLLLKEHPKKLKIEDIWSAIDNNRPKDMFKQDWKRTYKAVSLALEYINLKIEMTEEEFDNLEIPIREKGHLRYGERKIIVSKNNIICKPSRIDSILNGNSKLLSDDEIKKKQ